MWELFREMELAIFCQVNGVPPEDVIVWQVEGERGDYWFSLAPGAEHRRMIRRMYIANPN